MIFFVDGFDYVTVGQLARKWSVIDGGGISSPGVWSGSCLIIGANAVTPTAVLTLPGGPRSTLGVCFYYKPSFAFSQNLLHFNEAGGNHLYFGINSWGTLYFTRSGTALTGATSTRPLSIGVWSHIEVKVYIHDTLGTVECRVNGVPWISASALDTRNGGTGVIDALTVRHGNQNLAYVDHFILWDTSGARNNNFLGEKKVVTLLPTGAGAKSEWTPSAGLNFQNVDEATADDDTTYNYSANAPNEDLYTFGDQTMLVVDAVAVNLVGRKDDAGSPIFKEKCRSGGNNYSGASDFSPGSSYLNFQEIREVDPATSSQWSSSGVNNAEFGVSQTEPTTTTTTTSTTTTTTTTTTETTTDSTTTA